MAATTWKLKLIYFIAFFRRAFSPGGRFIAIFYINQGLSDSQIGAIISLAYIVQFIATPLWAAIADCTHSRYLVTQLMNISSGILVLLLLLPYYWLHIDESRNNKHNKDNNLLFVLLMICNFIYQICQTSYLTMVDTLTLVILNEDSKVYGKQRTFGAISWGIAHCIVGLIVDFSFKIANLLYVYCLTTLIEAYIVHIAFKNASHLYMYNINDSNKSGINYKNDISIAGGGADNTDVGNININYNQNEPTDDDMDVDDDLQLPVTNVYKIAKDDGIASKTQRILLKKRNLNINLSFRSKKKGKNKNKIQNNNLNDKKYAKIAQTPSQTYDSDKDNDNDDNDSGDNNEVELGIKTPSNDCDSNYCAALSITDESSKSGEIKMKISKRSIRVFLCYLCSNCHIFGIYFSAFTIGGGRSLVESLLFVYLVNKFGDHNINWYYTLLGLSVAVTVIFEIPFLFSSKWLLNNIGWKYMLYIGLICFIIRAFSYTLLTESTLWFLLMIEPLHGITFSLCHLAFLHKVNDLFDEKWKATGQGSMSSIRYGLGPFCFVFVGGYIMQYYGAKLLYACAGIWAIITLIILILTTWKIDNKLELDQISQMSQMSKMSQIALRNAGDNLNETVFKLNNQNDSETTSQDSNGQSLGGKG